MNSMCNLGFGLFIAVGMLIIPLGAIAPFAWYSAGVRAEAYQRQGIQMTQWESFWGGRLNRDK